MGVTPGPSQPPDVMFASDDERCEPPTVRIIQDDVGGEIHVQIHGFPPHCDAARVWATSDVRVEDMTQSRHEYARLPEDEKKKLWETYFALPPLQTSGLGVTVERFSLLCTRLVNSRPTASARARRLLFLENATLLAEVMSPVADVVHDQIVEHMMEISHFTPTILIRLIEAGLII